MRSLSLLGLGCSVGAPVDAHAGLVY